MTCRHCQAENDDTAVTCTRCGRGLFILAEGELLAGRYRIERLLGQGGMGLVYSATDEALDEKVAVKILKAEANNSADLVRRFRTEIRLARKVRHRNVCAIHEFGEEGRLQFIVMELIQGIDLKRLLRKTGKLAPVEAFDVAVQVARGLAAIHEVGVLHRDLKTPNIMRDLQGTIRLMDFGIAKAVDSATETATGMIVGTPDYMSPEQIEGKKLGPGSDIYSLGVVVYEVFMGQVPFLGDNALSIMWMHQNHEPPIEEALAAGLPKPLGPLLARALAKKPEDRFQTAEAFVEALVVARAETLPEAPTTPAPWQSLTAGVPPTTEAPGTGVSTAARPTSEEERASELDSPPPARSRLRLTLVALAAAALSVLAGTTLQRAMRGERSPPSPMPEATAAAVLASASPAITAVPGPDTSLPSPVPPPETPAPATPRPRRSAVPAALLPTAEPQRSTAPTPDPTVAPPPTPTTAASASAIGELRIRVLPWAEVEVDGTTIGTTPFKPLLLPPGPHRIGLRHPGYAPITREVTIAPGQHTRLDVDLTREGTPVSR